jgi:hypothetical protein
MAISPDDASVILSSTLNPTKGFHTTSTTRFALRGSRAHSCTLHLYLTLPAELFADPYELAHRHASYTFERLGGGDLEAPVFAPAASGPSALLLDVNIPEGVDNIGQIRIRAMAMCLVSRCPYMHDTAPRKVVVN